MNWSFDNLKRIWLWGASALVMVLVLFGLAYLASVLFDNPSNQQNNHYQTCLDHGGSYKYDGNSGGYTCTMPTSSPES